MSEEKMTSFCFNWMKEGHYRRNLYREEELRSDSKPDLFIKKAEHPKLWNHMVYIEPQDLKIEGVKLVVLLTHSFVVKEGFEILYYSDPVNKKSEQTAGYVSIFNKTSEEVIDEIKTKIAEAEQKGETA